MLYSTVNIKPAYGGKSWNVYFQDIPQEREENQESVNAWGFFHYERTRSKEEAFNILKDCMVKRHKEEIARLTESLKLLESLELGKGDENI